MKGGVGSQSLVVTIGSPTTYRISGQITTTNGPQQGVRVYVSTTRMAYTDSDGTYDIVGLPAGTYTVNASLQNYAFLPTFTNPVGVGPNKTGMNFASSFAPYTGPAITSQPTNRTINAGTSTTFIVGATGTAPTYQWRFNGANISGATGSSYTKSNAQSTNAGNYSVVVSNLAGTVTSGNAALTVNVPPSITTAPQSQAIIVGNTATFSVVATGTAQLKYQWRFNGTNLAGATTTSYVRTNVQSGYSGNYTVQITNMVAAITSAPANLIVRVQPQLGGPLFSNGLPRVLISGTPGDAYDIEISSNGLNWTKSATVTNVGGSVPFTDGSGSNFAQRFYRARLVP
jgi:hypothetical protein